MALVGRYVGDAHLDNTGLDDFRLPAYSNLDLRTSIGLGRFWEAGQPRIVVFVNNLLDVDDQYPSGYSYQFLNLDGAGGASMDGIPFYYPLATRNFVVVLELDL